MAGGCGADSATRNLRRHPSLRREILHRRAALHCFDRRSDDRQERTGRVHPGYSVKAFPADRRLQYAAAARPARDVQDRQQQSDQAERPKKPFSKGRLDRNTGGKANQRGRGLPDRSPAAFG